MLSTLVLFAAMFVLMKSVWDTGFFQEFFRSPGIDLTIIPPPDGGKPPAEPADLKRSARNPLPSGAGRWKHDSRKPADFEAASNVIIVQNAESRGDRGITSPISPVSAFPSPSFRR
ncbi:MAG: hypothetical protein HGB00_05435 [Chlorobiaceae bacterium]|nr:hypothetical protein [Chlorobiaceae bacterium]